MRSILNTTETFHVLLQNWSTGCKHCLCSHHMRSCHDLFLHSQKPTQKWSLIHHDPNKIIKWDEMISRSLQFFPRMKIEHFSTYSSKLHLLQYMTESIWETYYSLQVYFLWAWVQHQDYMSRFIIITSLSEISIAQFQYIKIQSKTIDLSTRLWGLNPTNSVVISWSLMLRFLDN